jgi:signal transduction histidine kinase
MRIEMLDLLGASTRHPSSLSRGDGAWNGLRSKCPRRGDHVRVLQCLINLAGNAIKFTRDGTVTISAGQRYVAGAPIVAVEVVDTGVGIGIDATELEALFKPFDQANPSIESEFGGTGLGLSITRSLAQAMGGDVTVESQFGHGSTFTLLLPAARLEVEHAALV